MLQHGKIPTTVVFQIYQKSKAAFLPRFNFEGKKGKLKLVSGNTAIQKVNITNQVVIISNSNFVGW